MSPCRRFSYLYGLDEVTKFPNLSSVHSMSTLKSASLWSSPEDPEQGSGSSSLQRGLLAYLLLYGLSCRAPSLVSDKKKKHAHVLLVNLSKGDLFSFFDKFLKVYGRKSRKKVFLNLSIFGGYSRMFIDDFTALVDISHVVPFFQSVDNLSVDIQASFFKNYQFIFFLDSLNRSSP